MTDLETPGAGPETSTSLTLIEPATGLPVPAMIAGAGERASLRFIDFFTAHIRNPNTRAAYGVAVRGFFVWLEAQGLAELGHIRTHHVSTTPRSSRAITHFRRRFAETEECARRTLRETQRKLAETEARSCGLTHIR
jgi:hypothetical protein